MHRLLISTILLVAAISTVSGCASGPIAGPALDVAFDGSHGSVYGGQQPVVGATVSIYEVGSTEYGVASTTPKATVTTDVSGNYAFPSAAYVCTAANTPMYLVATGGKPDGVHINANLAMVALIPACAIGKVSFVEINEVTTAAAVVAAGQFLGTALGTSVVPQIGATCTSCAAGTYNRGLVAAFATTYPMLVDNNSGEALTSGVSNGITITRESDKLNSIADILASCVNSTGTTSTTETDTACGKVFTGVNATGASTRPADTIQAALLIDLYPYYNVTTVYGYGGSIPPFPGLSTAPNDWTVAISYTSSNFGLGIAQNTSSNLDIDTAGNIWFPSNKIGAAGLAYFDPATTTMNGPYNSGLISPQYLTIDNNTVPNVWITDVAGKSIYRTPVLTPGVGGAVYDGTGLSYTNGGPLLADGSGAVVALVGGGTTYQTLKIANYLLGGLGTASISVLPTGFSVQGGDPSYAGGIFTYTGTDGSSCENGQLYLMGSKVSVLASTSECAAAGGVAYYDVTNALTIASGSNEISDSYNSFQSYGAALSIPEGVAVDGALGIWIANAGSASVSSLIEQETVPEFSIYTLTATSPLAYLHGINNGNTITSPYGIGVDASGNVWISNAGCVSTSATACTPGPYVLTEIVGAGVPTITPVSVTVENSTIGTKPTS